MTSDGEIIRRSLAVPSAFAELFDRHARVLGAFVSRRVGSEMAEDIVSETFLTAFRRRGSFDSDADSAKPWLLGIAVRLIRRHRALEAAHWRAVVSATRDAHLHDEGGIDAVGDRTDASAAVVALIPALRALSAKDRETLQLYAWAGLTYEELALTLGIPVGTVRSRLHRVRRLLGAAQAAHDAKEESRGSATRSG